MSGLIKKVVGYEGRYTVSVWGDIYSQVRKRFLKENRNVGGYPMVTLYDGEGGRNTISVHTIVAEAFLGKKKWPMQVNHMDGDKENNDISNLEWVTPSENANHAVKGGFRKIPSGSESKLAKPGSARSPLGEVVKFTCQKEFCGKYSLATSNFSKMLSGEYRSCKGWTRVC